MAVSTIDETSAELTLLSPNEQAATTVSDADAALATLGAAETAWPTANTTDAYRLRPVAVVSVTTE